MRHFVIQKVLTTRPDDGHAPCALFLAVLPVLFAANALAQEELSDKPVTVEAAPSKTDSLSHKPARSLRTLDHAIEKTIEKGVLTPIRTVDRAIKSAFEDGSQQRANKLIPVLVSDKELEPAVAANLRAYLEVVSNSELTDTQSDRARVEKAVYTAMRAMGYYRPRVTMKSETAKNRTVTLAITVTPDRPVLIGGTTVRLTGEAEQDPHFIEHLKTLPSIGTRLNHGDYERFKNGLSNLAAANGYFDAEFLKNELGVSIGRREAFWTIDFASGPRYAFGPVTFTGSQIDTEYLDNIVPFEPGDPFSAEELAEFSRRLSNTGWFESFIVAPDFETAANDPQHRLSIAASMTPRKGNSFEVGLGYATDVGPRAKLTWKKPWVNSAGHRLALTTEISSEEPSVDATYRIPVVQNPLEEYWLLQSGYKHTDLNDTEADTASFSVSRWWEFADGWQRSVRLRGSYDKFSQGDDNHSTFLLYPGISFSRIRSHGGAMPSWADSQRYSLDFAARDFGSDTSFVILQAQQSWIRSIETKHRFIFRAQAGYIETNDFDRVPPDLRFFAGGDRSVRGYKYKSISPTDDDGSLRGASSLLTASVEYQYNLTGKWWTALFLDAGEAVDHFKKSDFKEGAGVGVRWLSPVGPVKLDFAVPLNDSEADDFQILIGLGAEL